MLFSKLGAICGPKATARLATGNLAVCCRHQYTSTAAFSKELAQMNGDDDAALSKKFEISLAKPFKAHKCDAPKHVVTANKAEMFNYLYHMNIIRRMELAADALYKAKMIRGFCHLGIGQEAVAVGLEGTLERDDSVITAYRCHGTAYMRGASVHSILAELLGRQTGASYGKGGSMHIFAHEFYGGNGIVGAQVPVGAGIAFAQKYRDQKNVTFAMYGDGASNQGQVFEAYNMAALLKLPVIFVCENNHYGMGTSAERSSASTTYYSRGDYIPGLRADGMDVLSVRTASRFAKEWALAGKGPFVLEFATYRYQGHSMSDPGTTYRTRDEVQSIRATQDPIKLLQKQMLDAAIATEEEFKAVENDAKEEIDAIVESLQADPIPDVKEFWTNVYVKGSEPRILRGRQPEEVHAYSS